MGADYVKRRISILSLANNDVLAQNLLRYFGLPQILRVNEVNAQFTMPFGCLLTRMYVRFDSAPGGADNVVATLFLNGGATALTVNIVGVDVDGSNLVDTVAVAEGDTLSMRLESSATAVGIRASITIQVLSI